jgi:hypothetical protein
MPGMPLKNQKKMFPLRAFRAEFIQNGFQLFLDQGNIEIYSEIGRSGSKILFINRLRFENEVMKICCRDERIEFFVFSSCFTALIQCLAD